MVKQQIRGQKLRLDPLLFTGLENYHRFLRQPWEPGAQGLAAAVAAQGIGGGVGRVTQLHLGECWEFRGVVPGAANQNRPFRRFHAGSTALHPRLDQAQATVLEPVLFLPHHLLDGMGPAERRLPAAIGKQQAGGEADAIRHRFRLRQRW